MQRRFSALAAVVFALSGCASGPSVSASWQRPDYKPHQFKKLAVLAISGRLEMRRVIENHVAADLREIGIQAVIGSDLFQKPTVSDEKAPTADQKAEVRRILVQQGVDGAIVMRLVSRDIVESRVAAVASDPREAGDMYWGYSPVYDPVSRETTMDAKKRVVVEAGLFEAEKPGAIAVREITIDEAGTMEQVRDASKLIVHSFQETGLFPSH